MACYRAVTQADALRTPAQICRVFQGTLPVNAESGAMDDKLRELVLQAFRYAVKMAIDRAVIGETDLDDHSELKSDLEDLRDNWFVGPETSAAWTQAVLQQRESLFAISSDSKERDVVQSHLLTKQSVCVRIGRLNSAAVYGQWASMQLELLYMTNDDDERYSIQAHPVLLRNLTIQGAEPPLGYPIFSPAPVAAVQPLLFSL